MVRLRRSLDWLARILTSASVLLLVVITVVCCYEVFSRYALHSSHDWVEELTRFWLVACVFLILGPAYRRGSHIAITILVSRLGRRLGNLAAAFVDLVALAWFGVMVWLGVLWVMQAKFTGFLCLSRVEWPMWAVFMPVVIGVGIAFFYPLERLLRDVSGSSRQIDERETHDKR